MAYSPVALQAMSNNHTQHATSRFLGLDRKTRARVSKARKRKRQEKVMKRKIAKAKLMATIHAVHVTESNTH